MLYLTLRQFEYLAAVARNGSLVAAAAQLNVSQPSLSVALDQVEQRLGRKLFIRRRGAPVELTDFGLEYAAKVDELLALARGLDDPDLAPRTYRGRLTLGLFEDLAPFHAGTILTALRGALPSVEIRLRVADFETLAREMLQGRIDMAITFDLGLDASFLRTPLSAVRLHALVSQEDRLAAEPHIDLAAIADRPLILFEEALSARHMLGLFKRIGAEPVVRHRVRMLEVMRCLAAHGEGVGLTYSRPLSDLAYDGTPLVSVPISDAFAQEPIILAQPLLIANPGLATIAAKVVEEATTKPDAR